ncbi:NAD-dependent deacylase [candidate division KSB1 bacterium]|nr:NAD-dependent deacylase [candidate division KSB1 bacterium]
MIPEQLLEIVEKSAHIGVLTGAGISAESGIATFRGPGGLWSKFKPQELANVEAFLANPELVWSWYQHRRDVLADAKPNAGHLALTAWESLVSDFTLITQNVDGLHRLAGSQRLLELHGNIQVNRCQRCGLESDLRELRFSGDVPVCACGGWLRPGVVWFGESLPEREMQQAFEAAERADLFLTIGTSAQVYPAAALPELARDAGAVVVEINTEETSFSPLAHFSLRGKAGILLPALVERIAFKKRP